MGFGKVHPTTGKRNRNLISIDFANEILKIAYIRTSAVKKGAIGLVTRDIKGMAEDDIVEAIKTSLVEARVESPSAITFIPSSAAIIKNIEIPSTNSQEIKEIVDLQSARHTPYSPEEIIIGYINIGTFQPNYTRILLVIVNQDIVRKQLDILKKAGLEIRGVSFKPEGINNILYKLLKLESEKLPVAIMHVDNFSSDFIVSLKGKVIFTRSVSLGAQNFSQDKEKYINDFKEEVKKSLETYQGEEVGGAVSMWVLSGAVKVFQKTELEVVLKDVLDLPVKVFNYDNLALSEEASKVVSEVPQSSFLDVISPLLISEQLEVDLVPEEVKIQRTFKERSRNVIRTGVLVVTVLVLIGGILMSKIYFRELYLERLKMQYRPTIQEAQALEKTFNEIKLVRSYLCNRGYALEVLSQIYDLLPPEIYLDEIRFERQGTFSIKGTSTSMSSVFSFITSMENAEYYKDVKTRYTRKREEEGENLVDFEIVSILE